MFTMITQHPGWLQATSNIYWSSNFPPAQYGWPVSRASNLGLLTIIADKSPIQARVDEAKRIIDRRDQRTTTSPIHKDWKLAQFTYSQEFERFKRDAISHEAQQITDAAQAAASRKATRQDYGS